MISKLGVPFEMVRTVMLLTVLVAVPSAVSSAGHTSKCAQVFTSSSEGNRAELPLSAKSVWAMLRERQLLANQYSAIEGHKNLCGPTCAINLRQAARTMMGLPPDPTPNLTLKMLAPEFNPNGSKMNFDRFYELLRDLLAESHLPAGVYASLVKRSRSQLPRLGLADHVDVIELASLKPAKNELVLVIGAMFKKSKGHYGDHAMIVEAFDGEDMRLVDPSNPTEITQAQFKNWGSLDGSKVPIFFFSDGHTRKADGFAPAAVLRIKLSNISQVQEPL